MAERGSSDGVVSVFLGVVPGRDVFDAYLREDYDEEKSGINATCPLWDDLGIAWLDHDFQDAHYEADTPVPLEAFLSKQISYIDSFRIGVVESCSRLGIAQVNAGLFLYNYEYPSLRPFPSPFLRFVGCFAYTASISKWLEDLLRS